MSRAPVLAAIAILIAAPAPVRADAIFSPWIATIRDREPAPARPTVGITAGGMHVGAIGGEVDISFSSNFFDQPITNSAVTMMGNLIVGIPLGGAAGPGVRPYVSGGAGLIRTQIDTPTGRDDAENDLGFNLGGGLMMFVTDHFGLRGDLRYFRSLTEGNDPNDLGPIDFGLDLGPLHFWRASIGLVIR